MASNIDNIKRYEMLSHKIFCTIDLLVAAAKAAIDFLFPLPLSLIVRLKSEIATMVPKTPPTAGTAMAATLVLVFKVQKKTVLELYVSSVVYEMRRLLKKHGSPIQTPQNERSHTSSNKFSGKQSHTNSLLHLNQSWRSYRHSLFYYFHSNLLSCSMR
jgi:hypothetical protein